MYSLKNILLTSLRSSLTRPSTNLIRMSSTEVKKMKIEANTIGTHSGTFHCDEVLAVFMLRNHPDFKSHKLLRSRDMELLNQCDIVVDVGAVYDPATKRFDHHQSTFKETFSTVRPEIGAEFSDIRLSSAGLVYAHYGEVVIAEILKNFNVKLDENQMRNVYLKIYSGLIQEIDAIDNGIPQFDGEPRYRVTTHLGKRVGTFNPDWMEDCTPQEIDERFEKAVDYVGLEFIDKVKFFAQSWLPARKIVESAFSKRFDVHESGLIIELERFCPWQNHLREIEKEFGERVEIKFAVFNAGNKGIEDFRVRAVPVEEGSFVCRKFLSKKWFGLRDEELEQASGVKGAKFCHSTGHIGGNKTRDGTVEMAVKSLSDD